MAGSNNTQLRIHYENSLVGYCLKRSATLNHHCSGQRQEETYEHFAYFVQNLNNRKKTKEKQKKPLHFDSRISYAVFNKF